MRPGAVLVDISIDQGGCFATSHVTTHSEPTYVMHGVVHYCVGNMPGAVPADLHLRAHERDAARTSLAIASVGLEDAVRADPALAARRERLRGRGSRTRAWPRRTACRSTPLADLIDGAGVTGVAVSGTNALRSDADRFLDHLAVERGLSGEHRARRTVATCAGTCRSSSSWGIQDVPGVTDEAVGAYVVQLTSSTHDDGLLYRPASVARMLSAVRSFHRFELREGVTDHDPTVGIVTPKLPRSLPRPLSVDEVTRLLERRRTREPVGLRDRAILELLYGAGLRISELTGLDVDDVDLEEGSVRVLGKGGKERDVPVGRYAREAVSAYLALARGRRSRPPAAGRRSS